MRFMKMPGWASTALVAAFIGTAVAQDVDPLIIKGSKFFYKTNGTQFYIKGIAYQQDFTSDAAGAGDGFVDPLADPTGCQRDIPYLTQLGTNLIRVYALDPTKDHSDCMTMMANAGIYVLADLGSPDVSINSNDPSWNTALYARYTAVVDDMQQYSNTMGFFAGNEVITAPNQTNASPFVKAAVRDTKAYIRSKNYRTIGVGYATNDNPYIREQLANYMNCGEDQADAIDFWGYNVYSWCGDSSYEASGYNTRTEEFASYSVPVFFAEYGCNTIQPRMFTETPVLYGSNMDPVWSGGIVYLYFQEVNDYGLVSIDGNTVSTLTDFGNLKSEIATVSPSIVTAANYNPTNSPQACPSVDTNFSAVASPLPPTPDMNLCECMFSSLSCVVSGSVDEDSYGDLFGKVCGARGSACDGIQANGSTGTYGQYGMCNSTQQLGYVLNQYYSNQDSNPSACSWAGSAMTVAAATPAGSCAAQLSSASRAATGASESGAASSSKASASMNKVAGIELGYVSFGVYAVLGLVSVVGMIWL